MIGRWLEARRKRKVFLTWKRGFNFAAGALLAGTAEEALVALLPARRDSIDDFSSGIIAAIERWHYVMEVDETKEA